jgi:hypothetical protein
VCGDVSSGFLWEPAASACGLLGKASGSAFGVVRRAVAGVGGGRSGGVGRFRGLSACLVVCFGVCVCVCLCRGVEGRGFVGSRWWWRCGSWLAAESAAGVDVRSGRLVGWYMHPPVAVHARGPIA